jgi:hypothetical protein
MAWHEEGHLESFGKLCAAINHDIEHHFTNTVPPLTDRVNLEIHYPVVVGGELLDVRHGEDAMEIEAVDHIHYVQSWIAGNCDWPCWAIAHRNQSGVGARTVRRSAGMASLLKEDARALLYRPRC